MLTTLLVCFREIFLFKKFCWFFWRGLCESDVKNWKSQKSIVKFWELLKKLEMKRVNAKYPKASLSTSHTAWRALLEMKIIFFRLKIRRKYFKCFFANIKNKRNRKCLMTFMETFSRVRTMTKISFLKLFNYENIQRSFHQNIFLLFTLFLYHSPSVGRWKISFCVSQNLSANSRKLKENVRRKNNSQTLQSGKL